ncbi:hypothetical protein ALC53_05646 [Atta colombica]|uniref:Uncharacterized protein n=1 Tax=Atta colombica TaxID=520822 RepID=A0A151I434_9HYME|nr:hypothetical protein ALC53_05646 [Atta colombica]
MLCVAVGPRVTEEIHQAQSRDRHHVEIFRYPGSSSPKGNESDREIAPSSPMDRDEEHKDTRKPGVRTPRDGLSLQDSRGRHGSSWGMKAGYTSVESLGRYPAEDAQDTRITRNADASVDVVTSRVTLHVLDSLGRLHPILLPHGQLKGVAKILWRGQSAFNDIKLFSLQSVSYANIRKKPDTIYKLHASLEYERRIDFGLKWRVIAKFLADHRDYYFSSCGFHLFETGKSSLPLDIYEHFTA